MKNLQQVKKEEYLAELKVWNKYLKKEFLEAEEKRRRSDYLVKELILENTDLKIEIEELEKSLNK